MAERYETTDDGETFEIKTYPAGTLGAPTDGNVLKIEKMPIPKKRGLESALSLPFTKAADAILEGPDSVYFLGLCTATEKQTMLVRPASGTPKDYKSVERSVLNASQYQQLVALLTPKIKAWRAINDQKPYPKNTALQQVANNGVIPVVEFQIDLGWRNDTDPDGTGERISVRC